MRDRVGVFAVPAEEHGVRRQVADVAGNRIERVDPASELAKPAPHPENVPTVLINHGTQLGRLQHP